jgi:LacI family transcriptional regulator
MVRVSRTVAQSPRRVALAFPPGVPHTERITAGVLDYARGRSWELVLGPETAAMLLARLADRGSTRTRFRDDARALDGVLAFIASSDEARAVARLTLPVVNLSSALPTAPPYTVTVENRSVGQVAAQHLMQRGLARFGYCGVSDVVYGRDRGAGFVEAVRAAGHECALCPVPLRPGAKGGLSDRQRIERWLRRLDLPVGILAAHDYQARIVLQACADMGLSVPRDVAIVGVDNDVTLCELTSPTLSSVVLPGFDIGQRAAELLDRLMRGEAASQQPLRVAAREIVVRGSTDGFSFEDPAMSKVVKLINDRLVEPLTVGALAQEVAVTRRMLERRFRAALGASPNEYIRRARVERAKRLLSTTHALRLKEIAGDCGFPDVRSMNLAFRQLAGMSAADYRARRGR